MRTRAAPDPVVLVGHAELPEVSRERAVGVGGCRGMVVPTAIRVALRRCLLPPYGGGSTTIVRPARGDRSCPTGSRPHRKPGSSATENDRGWHGGRRLISHGRRTALPAGRLPDIHHGTPGVGVPQPGVKGRARGVGSPRVPRLATNPVPGRPGISLRSAAFERRDGGRDRAGTRRRLTTQRGTARSHFLASRFPVPKMRVPGKTSAALAVDRPARSER